MFPDSTAGAVVLALVPGLLRWWHGRTLRRRMDDAALPERLLAGNRRMVFALALPAALLGVLFTDTVLWGFPLMLAGYTVAGFPLRKALYQETWSLPAYLWFLARLLTATLGFWVLLTATPLIASYAGTNDWIAGLAIGGLLLAWNARYSEVTRWLLRAEPLRDPALRARFDGLAAKCGVTPAFEMIDLRGGAIANAVAVPSLRQPAAVFSDTLLRLLEADEVTAICAHELAHLEYYSPSRLTHLNRINQALVIAAALYAPAERLLLPESLSLMSTVFWAAAVAGTLIWLARDRQRNETNADLRAVELTGDPDALARGLVGLYRFARVPRRFDTAMEQRATHPSLARRIRAIRAASGTPAVTLDEPVTFVAVDGRTVVTFDRAQLRWCEPDAEPQEVAYARLTELRLDAWQTRRARLVAVDTTGHRRVAQVGEAELARLQSILDIVDAHLADPQAPRGAWPGAARAVAAFSAILTLLLGHYAAVLVAIVAWLRPRRPLLAAAAAGMLLTAGLALRESLGSRAVEDASLALCLLAMGMVTGWIVRSSEDDADAPGTRAAIAAIAAASVLALGFVLLTGVEPVRLHRASRTIPGAAVLTIALAAALACLRRPAARYAAIPAAAVSVAVTAAGSLGFLDFAGRDPMLVHADPMVWQSVARRPFKEFAAPHAAVSLGLSPHGRLVAFSSADDHGERTTFHVGAAGSELTTVVADELIFMDDARALVMAHQDDDVVVLRALDLSASNVVFWEQKIPGIEMPQLSYRPATNRWRVLGWQGAQQIVRVEGTVGTVLSETTRWPVPARRIGWTNGLGAVGGDLLLIETEYDFGLLRLTRVSRWAWLMGRWNTSSRLWRINAQGESTVTETALDADCVDAPLDDGRVVCSAFDGTRTRIVAIDPSSGSVAALMSMEGEFSTFHSAPAGWLTGWIDTRPAALRLASREAVGMDTGTAGHIAEIAVGEHCLGTLSFDSGPTFTVRLYSTAGPDAPGALAAMPPASSGR